MPVLTKEEENVLKARIFDLNEKSVKQVLFAVVAVLRNHPWVKTADIMEFIGDGLNLTRFEEEGKGV